MAEIILRKTLFHDLLTFRRGVPGQVRGSRMSGEFTCPTYTPDFVRLAESYGAKGIRVTKREEIEPAFREAMKSEKIPYIIEFEIDPEDLVYPMIKPGGTLEDMILDC